MDMKQLRISNYEKQRRLFTEEGFTEYIGTISVVKANVMALATAGPFMTAALLIYILRWKRIGFSFKLSELILFYFLLLLSIPIHEGIHGLTWWFFCKDKRNSIHFGVIWKLLTPYCHCSEPLNFSKYLLGGLMPFLVLGIGGFIASLLLGNGRLLFLSLLNMLAAGGDLTVACMLIPYKRAIILDHPTDCGFVAFEKVAK